MTKASMIARNASSEFGRRRVLLLQRLLLTDAVPMELGARVRAPGGVVGS
jgi:hypothetical protein